MTRVLSAALLLPLVLGVVWFLPPAGTLVLAIVASVLAFVEYARIAATLGALVPRALGGAAVVATCAAVGTGLAAVEVICLAALVLFGTLFVATRQPGPSALPGIAAAVFAMIYIGLPLGAIAAVRALAGREAVILLMIAIVISDSAQYYTGRALGRSALAPAISPKKTREGAIGGLVFGGMALAAGARMVFPEAPVAALIGCALAVPIAGIAGDLFESLLKRSAGVKDSSSLIPGHGGILDRIDSWLFAGPVYYLFVRYLHS
jgi:phosphatidate cytidylyltransferase